MKLKYALLFGFGLVIPLLFVACQSEIEPTIATSIVELVTSTVTPQQSLESITPSPLPSATSTVKVEAILSLVPDPTPSATAVPVTATPLPPSATPTIVEVTLTPLPTLEGEELELAVAELLANPMNCDVPCWWGAVPSETTVFEVLQFLTLYQFNGYYINSDGQIPDYIELWFGYKEDDGQFDFSVRYTFENHLLKIVFSGQSPTVYEILKKHGQPEEVWIETMSVERETLPVRFNMIYLQESMAVGYVADGYIQEDVVMGCFADEAGIIRINPPNSATSYKDFPTIFEVDRRYLSLEEATGLTMDEFMQDFSDPINPQCIETPAELWE